MSLGCFCEGFGRANCSHKEKIITEKQSYIRTTVPTARSPTVLQRHSSAISQRFPRISRFPNRTTEVVALLRGGGGGGGGEEEEEEEEEGWWWWWKT
jgi:hypothetical protein